MQVREIQMQPESVRVETDRLTLRLEEHRDEQGRFYEKVFVIPRYGCRLNSEWTKWGGDRIAKVEVFGPGEEGGA